MAAAELVQADGLGDPGGGVVLGVVVVEDGLAKAVTAAAARAVLAEGRAVLYNHDAENHTSARVAEAVGLHKFGRCHAVVAGEGPGPEEPGDRQVSTST